MASKPKYRKTCKSTSKGPSKNEQRLFEALSKDPVKGNASLETIQQILDSGADVNRRNDEGMPMLYFTTRRGRLDVLKELLSRGADPNLEERGKEGPSVASLPLHLAALHHLNCNCGCEGKNECLGFVTALLDAGARVDARGGTGITPLGMAVSAGRTFVVKELIKRGASPHLVDKFGDAPLFAASQRGYVAMVKCLIEAGADVNRKNRQGLTPLHTAAHNGHMQTVLELLKAGAEKNTTVVLGEYMYNARVMAIRTGHHDVGEQIHAYPAILSEHTPSPWADMACYSCKYTL